MYITSITYTVEKKRKCSCNYSAIAKRYYQKFHDFVTMPFFENFALLPLTQSQLHHCKYTAITQKPGKS